jgi:hypothetical protein
MAVPPIARGLLRGGVQQAQELARRAPGVARFAAQGVVGGLAIGAAGPAARYLGELTGRTQRVGLFQETLRFPSDLVNNYNYFMSMRFVKYEKRAISARKDIITQGSIFLPIPNQLNDTTTLNYDQAALGPMLGSFVESATGAQNPASVAVEGIAAEGFQRALSAVPGGANILNAVSAVSGLAINPFITVVFKNPSFKSHSFSWRLYPKSIQESEELTAIINTIKYHMLPGLVTSSGVLFEYPEMVIINLYPTDKHMYKFKPCIIKSLNVNYAPSSGPSFFRDNPGAPTGVEIRMELQEIEYFTKLDIAGDLAGIKPPDFFTPLANLGVDSTLLNLLRPGLGSVVEGIVGQGQ